MTYPSGQIGAGRAEEVDRYVEEVRAALADLPPSQREELLEDLSEHLTEVAAEHPEPLESRLGPPDAYAAELRAAVAPTIAPGGGASRAARLAAWREQSLGRLRRLDERAGPLFGYERFSEFGRLLVPAWWVLRGYLAAMLVVAVLDRQGQLGLLPRLGGSTIAGLVILGVAVAGSIWLAHRTPRLGEWPRRAVYVGSAVLALFALASLVQLDNDQRRGWPEQPVYVSENPHEHVRDVYVVDRDGRLLTDVWLLDQDGDPIDIGRACRAETLYPRCPEDLPLWARGLVEPTGTPAPSPPSPPAVPSLSPAPSLSPTPEPTLGTPPTPPVPGPSAGTPSLSAAAPGP